MSATPSSSSSSSCSPSSSDCSFVSQGSRQTGETATVVRRQVPLGWLRTDGGTQIRGQTCRAVVNAYAQLMRGETVFPPLVVVYDGQDYWLADGFHRLNAAIQAKVDTLDCLIHHGDRRTALLLALQANRAHGLPLSNQDKRRAVQTLLGDAEWSCKSDRWIAQQCGVDHKTVKAV